MTISDRLLGVVALVCFLSVVINWPKPQSSVRVLAFGLACLTAAYLF